MRYLAGIIALLILCAPKADAQLGNTVPYGFHTAGYCQITSLGSAAALVTASCSTGLVPPVSVAVICVSGAGIRYRDDGTNPTATVGIPVGAGVCFSYTGNLSAMAIIQQSAGAIVDAAFYY